MCIEIEYVLKREDAIVGNFLLPASSFPLKNKKHDPIFRPWIWRNGLPKSTGRRLFCWPKGVTTSTWKLVWIKWASAQ